MFILTQKHSRSLNHVWRMFTLTQRHSGATNHFEGVHIQSKAFTRFQPCSGVFRCTPTFHMQSTMFRGCSHLLACLHMHSTAFRGCSHSLKGAHVHSIIRGYSYSLNDIHVHFITFRVCSHSLKGNHLPSITVFTCAQSHSRGIHTHSQAFMCT